MSLEFKDIGDWTPSTVSIVDVPYHPLAYFEVYENDDEFVKKFKDLGVEEMSNQGTEKNVSISESFFEKLLGRAVAKRDPEPQPQNQTAPPQNDDEDVVTNAQILEAINKYDERLTAVENQISGEGNPEPSNEDDPEPAEGDQNQSGESNPEPSNEEEPQTVELPLNSDGTLDMDNAVVAKYIPRGTGDSQSLDGDLIRGDSSDKSFNERTGRDENGMTW